MTNWRWLLKNRLNYFGTLQKKLDAHQTKAESIDVRKKWLERQKVADHQNECDRISGVIAQNDRKGVSVEHSEKRKNKLEK